MGLSSFPSPAEGMLVVMNTVLSVANVARSVLGGLEDQTGGKSRPISITQFKSGAVEECSVCLNRFEPGEQVSELLSCNHFFHTKCLDKWFHHHHLSTCPLCRSIY